MGITSHNILITGCSGYLGGTILARWHEANLPAYKNLYGLVRTEEQAEAVKQYGAKPLTLDLQDEASLFQTVVDLQITIIYFLIDAVNSEPQVQMIKALATVKKITGLDVHFLQTSGAKIFGSTAGHPIDRPLSDADPDLYKIQKSSQAPYAMIQKAMETNNTVIETSEAYGVRSHIFVPCIVYGKGEGFGNPTSIQTKAIIQAASKVRQVYKVGPDHLTWPVCHLEDTTALYFQILRQILLDKHLGHGQNGYYLASSGSVAWIKIYESIAVQLKELGLVDDDVVKSADDGALQRMGEALGCPKEFVPLQLSGMCTLEADNGRKIGWKPQYPPEHIIEYAKEEVRLVLQNLDK